MGFNGGDGLLEVKDSNININNLGMAIGVIEDNANAASNTSGKLSLIKSSININGKGGFLIGANNGNGIAILDESTLHVNELSVIGQRGKGQLDIVKNSKINTAGLLIGSMPKGEGIININNSEVESKGMFGVGGMGGEGQANLNNAKIVTNQFLVGVAGSGKVISTSSDIKTDTANIGTKEGSATLILNKDSLITVKERLNIGDDANGMIDFLDDAKLNIDATLVKIGYSQGDNNKKGILNIKSSNAINDTDKTTYGIGTSAIVNFDNDTNIKGNIRGSNKGNGLLSINKGSVNFSGENDYSAETNISKNAVLISDGNKHPISKNSNFIINGTLKVENTLNQTAKSINNAGTIVLGSDKNKYITLTVNDNYKGSSEYSEKKGALIVNTYWDNDKSLTGSLDIKGKVTGFTQVATKDGKIIGNVTKDTEAKYSAPVVSIGDAANSTKNAFYGFADTKGAGQAILVQKDANNYTWYLAKKDTPVKPVDPVDPVDPIKPEVPGFVHMPTANMEMGYNLIRTLHERIGEQQTMAWDDCSQCQVTHHNGQVWGKMLGNLNQVNGDNRYGYHSKMWGSQFGYDFDINYNAETDSRRHSGVMVTYAHDTLKFNDSRSVFFDTNTGKYGEHNVRTGTGKSDTVALGAYSTFYDKNGSYLDLVGNLDYTHSNYKSYRSSESSNNSYGVTLSGEVGRPYALNQNGINNGDWEIEPQVQLIYQYRTFSNFKTKHDVNVDQKDRHGLRGRAGLRMAYDTGTPKLKTNTIYFVGNVVHDFINNDQFVAIGLDHIKEKTATTFGEMGGGVQLPISDNAYMYIDTRYSHSLNKSSGKAEGVRGNLGFKYHF